MDCKSCNKLIEEFDGHPLHTMAVCWNKDCLLHGIPRYVERRDERRPVERAPKDPMIIHREARSAGFSQSEADFLARPRGR